MFLFSRTARLVPGDLRKSMEWALNITEKVNQVTELDLSLWTTVFSAGVGTLSWTAVVEQLAVLEASDAKLMADDLYMSLLADGAKHIGTDVNDMLAQLVYADPDGATIQAQYATVVDAVLSPGASVKGIELGVQIAQQAKATTGSPTSFAVGATGAYGGVAWIVLYDSVEKFQASGDAIAADAAFNELIDREASKCYLPGRTTTTTFRKIM
jgi:hypothetical protein